MGIRTARIERGPLELSLRAVGRVTADETALVDVSIKTRGWITRLDVSSLGAPVRKGETLFLLYSPQLFAAQQQLLQALRSQGAASGGSAPNGADPLVRAARRIRPKLMTVITKIVGLTPLFSGARGPART